jgi:hypothetical protein
MLGLSLFIFLEVMVFYCQRFIVSCECCDSCLENGDISIVLPNPMQANLPLINNRVDLSRERIIGCKNINTTCCQPLTELNTSKTLAILKTQWEIVNIVVWMIRVQLMTIWIFFYEKILNFWI